MFNILLTRNDAKYRLLRTIVQGILGVIVAYLDVLLGYTIIPNELRPMVVALVMAVLSPIMKAMGTDEMNKPELPHDHFEGGEDDGE